MVTVRRLCHGLHVSWEARVEDHAQDWFMI